MVDNLSSSPIHSCPEAVLGSWAIKHFIFTYSLVKDLGPGRTEGAEALITQLKLPLAGCVTKPTHSQFSFS